MWLPENGCLAACGAVLPNSTIHVATVAFLYARSFFIYIKLHEFTLILIIMNFNALHLTFPTKIPGLPFTLVGHIVPEIIHMKCLLCP